MKTEDINIIKDNLKQRIDNKHPNFESSWKSLCENFDKDFVEYVREQVETTFLSLKDFTNFKLQIVIDNNFIFGQIKSTIEKGHPIKSTFVYRLITSSFVDVYAPYKLKDELYDKIETVLETENDRARSFADMLLTHIKIQDATWTNEWKRAKNAIGQIDIDDVPYLALALDVKGDAVLSNDKIFKKQGEVNSWNLQDTESKIRELQSGFLAFSIVGGSIVTFIAIVTIIFRFIFKMVEMFLGFIFQMLEGGITALAHIPGTWLVVIIALLGFSYITWKDDIHSFIKEFSNLSNDIVNKIKPHFYQLKSITTEFWQITKPLAIDGIEILVYLTTEYIEIEDKIENYNKARDSI